MALGVDIVNLFGTVTIFLIFHAITIIYQLGFCQPKKRLNVSDGTQVRFSNAEWLKKCVGENNLH